MSFFQKPEVDGGGDFLTDGDITDALSEDQERQQQHQDGNLDTTANFGPLVLEDSFLPEEVAEAQGETEDDSDDQDASDNGEQSIGRSIGNN